MVGLILIGFSAGLGLYSTDLVCLLAGYCVIVVRSGDWIGLCGSLLRVVSDACWFWPCGVFSSGSLGCVCEFGIFELGLCIVDLGFRV